LAVGVATPAALVSALLLLPKDRTNDAAGHTSASLVLTRFAHIAAAKVSLQPGPGQYVYEQRSGLGFTPGSFSSARSLLPEFWVYFNFEIQSWSSPTTTGGSTQTDGPATPARSSDEMAWRASGSPPLAGPTTRTSQVQATGSTTELGNIDISKLSTDPAQLGAELDQYVSRENSRRSGPGTVQLTTVISLAQELLGAWQTPPTLRAAVFQVLAEQPGVSVQPRATDHAGQVGTGITATQAGERWQLIVDPATSVEIGYDSTVVDPSLADYPSDAAGLAGWVVVQPPIVVDSLGATS
ncbi:MAG: CU044_5270 family protein, partial [Acidimicrobiales bacterium]